MSDSSEQYVNRLHDVTVALDRGDWRSAMLGLAEGGDAGDQSEVRDLTFCLKCVTRGLRFQCVLADVEAAWYQLDAAAVRLGEGDRPVFGAEPVRRHGVLHLRWVTTRLVLREQADLEALRQIVERLPRGRTEVVYACVEHLTHIEHDPFTVRVHPRDRELTGLDDVAYARWRTGNRKDMCLRATRLRQFADVRGGTVNERTWQRMGGYPCVREHALRVLAREPVTRGRRDFPVRLGRRRAWAYARQWVEDTDA